MKPALDDKGRPAVHGGDEQAPTSLSPRRDSFYDHYEDEISLIDLWLVLVRRKWWLAGVSLAAIIGGAFYAFVTPDRYDYRTILELGERTVETESGRQTVVVEPPQQALAKLQNSYIPTMASDFARSQGQRIDLTAQIPPDSDLIVLESTGSEAQVTQHRVLHQRVVDKLVQAHQAITENSRGQLRADLQEARAGLEELRDPATLEAKLQELRQERQAAQAELEELRDPRTLAIQIKSVQTRLDEAQAELTSLEGEAELLRQRRQRLDNTAQRLEKRISQTEARIQRLSERRQALLTQAQNGADGALALLLESDLQQARAQLAELEERLHDGLAAQRQEIEQTLTNNKQRQAAWVSQISALEAHLAQIEVDNERAQARLQNTIDGLEIQIAKQKADHQRLIERQERQVAGLEERLAGLQATSILTGPMQSLQPQGMGSQTTVTLATVLGLLLGVFAAFFAEFVSKARRRAAQLAG